jgi:shikimate kinase|tara:strand:- start:131 stop:643 length:513 start_codon:yes stop_codon:yes gene_type:complete
MNSKKNLVFLGMMGSGKSSIGFLVAKKLNLKFIDIDNIIEKEVGMKIADIFKDKGENYFRILEEKNTLKVLNFNNNVISLGGGAFMNNKIRKKVLSNNFSFWLNWNAETLLIRIKKNKKRPLAFNSSDTELMSLIKSRSKIYSKAQIKINCNNLKKSEIIEKILKIYEPN